MNLIWADSGIFSALACLGLSCFTHFQEYSLSYAYQGIFAHIRAYCSRFRHIQDSCITDPNSVKQHRLFKSGFSFKSLSRSIWNIFNFFSKVNIQYFFLRDSISVITITIIIACQPCQYATHGNALPTPPMPPTLVPHPRKDTSHVAHTMPHTPPTLERITHHFSNSFTSFLL